MLSAVPPPVTVRVPAKINLHLEVGGLRDDGFHDLVTVFHAVSLFDEVSVAVNTEPAIAVHGEGVTEVPADETNLAWRAVQLLAERADRDPDVALVLRKGIPVAGGMAGGSADAAAALVGLSALWKLDLSRDELSGLAAELGSDVTFALHGGTALGTGRGEQIVPVLSRHTQHWVIALHRGGLSTPAVFGELDRLRGGVLPARPARRAGAGGHRGRRPAPARPLAGQRPAARRHQPRPRAAPHPARRGRRGRARRARLRIRADVRVPVRGGRGGAGRRDRAGRGGRVSHRPGGTRAGAGRADRRGSRSRPFGPPSPPGSWPPVHA